MSEETLYVAVSESDKPYAGYDGGEQTGGRGRWRVGFVGTWTAKGAVPLARRDPKTGLIRSGYLEEVITSRVKDDGTVVAVQTKQVFETQKQMIARLREAQGTAAPEGASRDVPEESETVLPAAASRAKHGAGPIKETLQGKKGGKGKPASPDKVLQGRVSDNPVG